jgi:4-amino-4-deoxy-L-arabinose transferase-like glycosyltransferase
MLAPKPPRFVFWLVLVLAFALRLYKSDAYGIFFDEKSTLVISQGVVLEGANQKDVFFTPGKTYFTPAEFWKPKTFADFIEANVRNDIGNSPAYYGVLWVWMEVFGLSDQSARFPSILFSTLLVGLVYLFVRRFFRSEPLALLSAFITALEPFYVAYSHMARNYSMSFCLTLLATYLFLLLMERARGGQRVGLGLYVAYGATLATSILSHYLTLTVFLCHGLYLLLYVRQLKTWVAYTLTGAVALGLVSLWFVHGGGQYTFQTLAYQANLYKELAYSNPTNNPFGLILPATPASVAKRSLPLFADLFMVANGLGQPDTLGYKNLGMALLLGLAGLWVVRRFGRGAAGQPVYWQAALAVLLLAGLPFYSTVRLQFMVVTCLPTLAYLAFRYVREELALPQRPLVVLTVLLAFLPTLFLGFMAFRSGHTYGLTQRYSGFSFPYTAPLVAMMLLQTRKLLPGFRYAIWVMLLVQLGYVARVLKHIYEGREPKYTYFSKPRIPNPYYATAQQIKAQYAEGDTILYPSIRLQPRDTVEKTYWPYSITDAQLTNLYLPKTAQYYQRMDTTQIDRILLKKRGNPTPVVLFDFKGNTYRY